MNTTPPLAEKILLPIPKVYKAIRSLLLVICLGAALLLPALESSAQGTTTGTIEITEGTLSINEGDSGSFDVSLSAAPSAQVTVSLSNTNTAVFIYPSSLTFTTSNWSANQSITVNPGYDSDSSNGSDTITLSASGGISAPNATKQITIVDGDNPGYEFNPGSLVMSQGPQEEASIRLRLKKQPSVDLTLRLSIVATANPSNFGVDTDPNTTGRQTDLTFNQSGTNPWNQYRTVKVFASGSLSAGSRRRDEQFGISVAPTGSSGDYANTASAIKVTANKDRPQGNILVTPAGTLNIDEGDSATLSVKLSVAPHPNSDATVVLSNRDKNPDVTLSTESLTFTASNYDIAQTVTVTAAEDSDRTDDNDTIIFSATRGIEATLVERTVLVTDRPSGTIDVTPAGMLNINEGDSGTLSIELSVEPSADVTVSLSKTNADVSLSPTSLTFTASNYDTAQTVTVTAAEDSDGNDETDTITLSASGGIIASPVTKSVAIKDNEPKPGTIELTPAGTLTIAEGDSTGVELSIELSVAPSTDVTVRLTKKNSDVLLSPAFLTFTASNYDTAQTVTVTAAEDNDGEDDTDTITLSATGGITAPDVTRSVVITDNEPTPGTIQITPTGTLTIDEGDSAGGSFSVTLSETPDAAVTVSLSKTNADVTLSPTSLTFTASNYNTAQRVTVTAAEDDDSAHESDTITLSATGGITAPKITKNISITDDDTPSGTIEITPVGALGIDEGHSTGGALFIALSDAPNSDVTLTLSKTNDDVSLSPATLTFTASNYENPQKVIVTAGEDNDESDDTDTITFSATGGIIAPNATKAVSIFDNDVSGSIPQGIIVLSPSGRLSIDEGASSTLLVSLGGTPKANARIAFSKTNSDVTLSPAFLRFTPANHFNPQTVTVTAAQDDDASDDTGTITFEVSGGIAAPPVAKEFLIVDDDPAPPTDGYEGSLVIAPVGSLIIDEGGQASIEVSLSAPPSKEISLRITKVGDAFGIVVLQESMIFTPSNWNQPQSVEIAAQMDPDILDEAYTIAFSFEGKRIDKAIIVRDEGKTRSRALALPPPDSEDEVTLRIRCKQRTPCHVAFECSAQSDGSLFQGRLPEAIPAFGAITLSSAQIQRFTGGDSWAGKGRLGCSLIGSAQISSQVWTRSGDGVLVNNSAAIRSA
ncbi:MAG: hypothetical protein ISN28_12365, partial [Ectothiorhodospiraceae bacterium AqS1]|nr:hypothetical protein [Ectothiorhodospiraceae bacterium AqS1]